MAAVRIFGKLFNLSMYTTALRHVMLVAGRIGADPVYVPAAINGIHTVELPPAFIINGAMSFSNSISINYDQQLAKHARESLRLLNSKGPNLSGYDYHKTLLMIDALNEVSVVHSAVKAYLDNPINNNMGMTVLFKRLFSEVATKFFISIRRDINPRFYELFFGDQRFYIDVMQIPQDDYPTPHCNVKEMYTNLNAFNCGSWRGVHVIKAEDIVVKKLSNDAVEGGPYLLTSKHAGIRLEDGITAEELERLARHEINGFLGEKIMVNNYILINEGVDYTFTTIKGETRDEIALGLKRQSHLLEAIAEEVMTMRSDARVRAIKPKTVTMYVIDTSLSKALVEAAVADSLKTGYFITLLKPPYSLLELNSPFHVDNSVTSMHVGVSGSTTMEKFIFDTVRK